MPDNDRYGASVCPVCGYMTVPPVCMKCGEPFALSGRELARWAVLRALKGAVVAMVGTTVAIGFVLALVVIVQAL